MTFAVKFINADTTYIDVDVERIYERRTKPLHSMPASL